MPAVVVQKSSKHVATRSMSWKGYENFKRVKILVPFKILVANRSNSPSLSGRGMGGA